RVHREDSDFFFSSRRRHTRSKRDWSSDVCSSDLASKLRHGKRTSSPGPEVICTSCWHSAEEPQPTVTCSGVRSRCSASASFSSEIGRASCRERVDISACTCGGQEKKSEITS